MSTSTTDFHGVVWEALQDDATLAGYVKQWVRGTGTPQHAIMFPYLEFNILRFSNEIVKIGPRGKATVETTYTCAIDIMLSNLSIDVLFAGDDNNPGIYEFIDDVIAVVQHKQWGILEKPSIVRTGEVIIAQGDKFIVGATIDLECVVSNLNEICGG